MDFFVFLACMILLGACIHKMSECHSLAGATSLLPTRATGASRGQYLALSKAWSSCLNLLARLTDHFSWRLLHLHDSASRMVAFHLSFILSHFAEYLFVSMWLLKVLDAMVTLAQVTSKQWCMTPVYIQPVTFHRPRHRVMSGVSSALGSTSTAPLRRRAKTKVLCHFNHSQLHWLWHIWPTFGDLLQLGCDATGNRMNRDFSQAGW